MENKILKVLFTQEEIKARVKAMAQEITDAYHGKEILAVGILKGAVMFLSDLVREIKIPVAIDFMAVSSYGTSTDTSGVVRILKDLDQGIENRHVLIVEDIVDTGLTLKYLVDNLKTRNPASVRTCTFLDKPGRRKVEVQPDYNGFSIPDEFVVGFGLDYAEQYRQFPYIGILKPEVYKSK